MDLKGLRLMSNSIKKILLIINIVILFVVTGFSANKEESYKKLDSYFYLELTPVDPRSLLQGDYMTLNYSLLKQPLNNEHLHTYLQFLLGINNY